MWLQIKELQIKLKHLNKTCPVLLLWPRNLYKDLVGWTLRCRENRLPFHRFPASLLIQAPPHTLRTSCTDPWMLRSVHQAHSTPPQPAAS